MHCAQSQFSMANDGAKKKCPTFRSNVVEKIGRGVDCGKEKYRTRQSNKRKKAGKDTKKNKRGERRKEGKRQRDREREREREKSGR